MLLAFFQKLRIIFTEGRNRSAADMQGHFFAQEELLLKHLEHNQLPPKIHFASLNHDNQIKPVHFFVKDETSSFTKG